jgi:hypothetical protein
MLWVALMSLLEYMYVFDGCEIIIIPVLIVVALDYMNPEVFNFVT